MTVRLDEQAYRTLKLFLLSCHSTLGEEALITFFKFKEPFPTELRDTLRDFSWVVEELPGNVFKRLEEYAQKTNKTELSAQDICLFFGGREHFAVVEKSCIVYVDLLPKERLAGHLTLPVRVTDIYDNKLSGQVTYNGMQVSNIFNVFEDVVFGDIVLVHFATVVLANPNQALLAKLTDIQQDIFTGNIAGVDKLFYKDTYTNTKEKIQKYY